MYDFTLINLYYKYWGCRCRDHMLLNLQQSVQSVRITTTVVSLNPVHLELYSIKRYVIKKKFVRDLRQVGGFLWVLQISSIQ